MENTSSAVSKPGNLVTIYRSYCSKKPSEYRSAHESLAAIIDDHMRRHEEKMKQATIPCRNYVLIGPSNDSGDSDDAECQCDGYKCFYTIQAYDALHAKYLVVKDCAEDALAALEPCAHADLVNCTYSYPITAYLEKLINDGADLTTCMDVFRTHSLSPFVLMPFTNYEITIF